MPREGGRRGTDPGAVLQQADAEIERAERLLDVAVVARELHVSATTVRNWIHLKKLRSVTTPSGRYRVPASELDRILMSQASQASQG